MQQALQLLLFNEQFQKKISCSNVIDAAVKNDIINFFLL